MKKYLLLILSLVLVLTLAVPSVSFADYDEALEEAILKAKEVFQTDNYDEFDYHVNKYGEESEFYLRWSDSSNKLNEIIVTVNSKGRISSYRYFTYRPYYRPDSPQLAKISRIEAKLIVDKFIRKLDSDYIQKTKYQPDDRPLKIYDKEYDFIYIRQENGVLFPSNTMKIYIDNMTGDVTAFSTNWEEDLEFPTTDGIITLEEGQEAFKDQIGLQLVYKFKYVDDKIVPYLVFTNLTGKNHIDAKTGEFLKSDMYYGIYNDKIYETDRELSPAEYKSIENIKDILSKEFVEELIREKLNMEDEFKMYYINFDFDWRNKDESTWSMGFRKEDKENPRQVSVVVNAKTGQIKSFYKTVKLDKDKTPQYNKEQSQELAEEFIKKHQPEKYEQVEYVDWNQYDIVPLEGEELPRSCSFYFIRKENDAYVSNSGFNLTVDTVTGEVTSYNLEWFKGELPVPEGVISIEEANEIFFNEIGIELKYIEYYSKIEYRETMTMFEPKRKKDNREIKLVYSIKNDKPLNIDSKTGNIVNHIGEAYKENIIVKYTDIENSDAKSEIEVLAQYGIALPEEKLYPTNKINQREFLYLLAKANDFYIRETFSDDSKFDEDLYERLLREGIVKKEEKSPESNVIKEDAVKFIIRSLKYDKIASMQEIYLLDFKDAHEVSPELRGHIAIANILNIISPEDEYFIKPINKLTKEEAFIMIYNYLKIN